MTGLFIYAFTACGLGLLLPSVRIDGRCFSGLRFFGGLCLFVLGFPLLHLLLGLSLTAAAWTLLGLAAVGIALALRRMIGNPLSLIELLHPVPVLLALGIAAIAVHGTPDYLPFTSDEFSNWIGASRHIFMVGDYDAIKSTIHLPGYTPGWRFALLYPWVFSGGIHEGYSAAAPFVAHVGLMGLVFDVVAWVVSTTGRFDERRTALLAWAFLGIALAGEAGGLLWARSLLIEPPQIYTLAVAMTAMVLLGWQKHSRIRLAAYAGLALATSYVLKIAAITLAPVAVLIVIIVYMNERTSRPDAMKRAVLMTLSMLVPLLAAAVLWKLAAPETGSVLSSPGQLFTGKAMARILERDWLDLAGRYGASVWSYMSGYKTPLTLLAVIALALSAARGRYHALLVWGGFFLSYALSLYWWHLTGAGEYYFRELNSIERFMRIPVRTLHILGLLAIAIEAGETIRAGRLEKLSGLAKTGAVSLGLGAAIVLSVGFQAVQVFRSLEDISSRKYQHVDHRIPGAKAAIDTALGLDPAGRSGPVRLILIAQGMDGETKNYAKYFAHRPTPQDPNASALDVLQSSSWSPKPQNRWQAKAGADELLEQFRRADIIWPLRLDPWVRGVLERLAYGGGCPDDLAEVYLVRAGATAEFSCLAKKKRP